VIAAELEAASKRFGMVTALAAVTIAIGEGEVVALLGPNGAGKSTAISVLLGLRVPEAGTARLFGLDPRRARARRDVGVAPQETAFPPTLRVAEVIELVRRHYSAPVAPASLSERFGLGRLLRRQLGGLSGGERRLVAVALAFAGRPRLLVLDEPTASLDGEARVRVWSATRAHARAGGAVLLTTHHVDEAEALAQRVVLLESGAVVADGSVDELKRAAGLTRVSFRVSQQLELPGAVHDGETIRADVEDAGAFVAALVRRGVELAALEVRPLTLEEAIVAHKARR
jgi:ABC-2 type transport system ATP-binding protein